MRLFVAAELPPALREALSETSALLRDSVRGRFVGSDLFHVTLAFLGEVPTFDIEAVEQAVGEACRGQAPFTTTLGGLGNFGRATDAILWQGFTAGGSNWDALATAVRKELRGAGFSFDTKGFIPHVTLMRRADLGAGILPMPHVASATVDTVTLFSSDLSEARPRYEAVASWTLADGKTW